MKIRFVTLTLTLAGLFAAPLVAQDEPKTPLGEQMSALNDAFRGLRDTADDASKNAASAALVHEMIEHATKSLEFKPAYTDEQPADQQAEFVAKYQEGVKGLIATLERLEAAFKADNNALAAEIIGEIRSEQRTGHRTFRKPRDS